MCIVLAQNVNVFFLRLIDGFMSIVDHIAKGGMFVYIEIIFRIKLKTLNK